jgi:hypothetical protein
MNTWTMLAAELTGRSYGGGVLELMPSEANRLPMPEPDERLEAIFDTVDERVRIRQFYDALSIVDDIVMPRWMAEHEKADVRQILVKLINRRKSRKHVAMTG